MCQNYFPFRFYQQLTDQLRKNLKLLDTLADDASNSEDEGYVNIYEDDEEPEKKLHHTVVKKDGRFRILSKIKRKFSRKK